MAEFFDTVAELGSEEEDEDFDGEAGERPSKSNGDNAMDDSSEEEDDDDEERIRQVRHARPRLSWKNADSRAGRRRLHCR